MAAQDPAKEMVPLQKTALFGPSAHGLGSRWFGRYQFKIALSYLSVFMVVLALLNTYPILVTQDFMFESKRTTLSSRVRLIATTLSAFDELTQETTAKVMDLLPDESALRIVVTDPEGRILYDNAVSENAVGRVALLPEIRDALLGGDVFFSRAHDTFFESTVAGPVMSRGRVIGAVYVYEYDPEQAAMLSGLRATMMNFSVVITAAVVILSVFLSFALTRRVGELAHAIRSVRDGRFAHRAAVRGNDELARVTIQFNELTERLQKTEDLRRQFVSDASHELKTPLASVRLLTDSILQTEDMDGDTVREFVADIGQEVDRLSRMTEKLMTLTRIESVDTSAVPVELARVVRRTLHMLSPLAAYAQVSLSEELGEGCVILAQEDDMYQVVYNLVENAVKYNRPEGRVRVFLYAQHGFVYLIVEDTGAGIEKEELVRIFDRFYRVDKARSRDAGGAGLGLSIVQEMLARYSGMVEASSESGKGSRFTVTFPLHKEEET